MHSICIQSTIHQLLTILYIYDIRYVNPYAHLEDWHTVIKYIHNTSNELDCSINPDRVSVWGSSFAGGHVLKLASDEPSLECCIAQVPFVGGLESITQMPLSTIIQSTTYALYDTIFSGILGIIKPYRVANIAPNNKFAILSSPDSYPSFLHMSPTNDLSVYKYNATTPARTILHVLTYRPLWNAHHIIPKTLIMAGKNDLLIPYWAVERGAKRIYGVEFDGTTIDGHFDPYEKKFNETVEKQTDFLRRNLNL